MNRDYYFEKIMRDKSDPGKGPGRQEPGKRAVLLGFLLGVALGAVTGVVVGTTVPGFTPFFGVTLAFVGGILGAIIGHELKRLRRKS